MPSTTRRRVALSSLLFTAICALACVADPGGDAGDVAMSGDGTMSMDGASNDAVSMDARPPGPLGARCLRNAECASNVCLNTGICSTTCGSTDECVAGWMCTTTGSEAVGVCQCAPTRDVCNGRDDDCNGIVDDGAMCDGPEVCQAGACVCPPQDLCNGTCTDTLTDAMNCGACGNACPSGMGCAGGGCLCADGVMVSCNGTCTDLRSDANNCGACGHACGAGATCYLGGCVPHLIAPMSTTTVTTQRPTLHWIPAASRTMGAPAGAHVEICSDRNCQHIEQRIDAVGASTQPAEALAPGPHYWHASGPADRVFGPTWQFWVGTRNAAVDASSMVGADINADGYGDVIIGAADGDAAWMYLGQDSGLGYAISLGLPLIEGTTAVGVTGDLNGDGRGDLVMAWSGEAFVRYGAYTTASLGGDRIVSPRMDNTFGTSVSSAGDFNGDGYADMVLSEPGTHRVYLYSGNATGFGATPLEVVGATGIQFGAWVADAGDLNADGYGDFAVAAPGANSVFVYLGRADGTASSVSTLLGPLGSSQFGSSVASAGDIDGDGYADLIVGANGSSTAYVFHGSARGISGAGDALTPPSGSTGFGASVAAAGDVNADGFGDVIVGAPGANAAYVFMGSASGFTTPPATLSYNADSGFGTAVGTIGDANHDGFADVIVGAPTANAAVYFLGSATGPATTGTTLPGAYSTFGNSIAATVPRRARPRTAAMTRSVVLRAPIGA